MLRIQVLALKNISFLKTVNITEKFYLAYFYLFTVTNKMTANQRCLKGSKLTQKERFMLQFIHVLTDQNSIQVYVSVVTLGLVNRSYIWTTQKCYQLGLHLLSLRHCSLSQNPPKLGLRPRCTHTNPSSGVSYASLLKTSWIGCNFVVNNYNKILKL